MVVIATTTSVALAQRTISGKVIEQDSKEAVIQATVALLKTDSSLVTNAVTNMNGQFQLTAPRDASYILRITYVGFKTYTKRITVADGKGVNMGTISLAPDAIMLKGTTVTAHIAKVQSKGDTLIYNADAYRTPEGSVVEELVKRLPGAEVDDDGNIKINGKTVSKVRVDGKEFGDTKTALKNLPTNIVERIRAYDEKSDLSRITGIDDGNEQTVIDFGLRQGMNRGMFGNADLAAGTESRYAARLFGMMMRGDHRLMAMANANNTNDMGFGGGGGRGFGGGRGMGGGGLNAAKSGMLNYNYEKTNLIIAQANVNWNHRDGDTWSRRASENFVGSSSSFQNSVNQSYSRSNSWSASGRIEWTPDTLWNISFRPNLSYSTNDGTSDNVSASFNTDPYTLIDSQIGSALLHEIMNGKGGNLDSILVNASSSRSLTYGESKNLGGTLMVNRLLNGKGRNITLQLQGNYSNSENKQLSNNQTKLFRSTTTFNGVSGLSEYQTNRYNLTPTTTYDYSARATYSEPIAYATFLQFSYSFQYRYNESDRSTYDYSNPLLSDPTLGYDFSGVKPVYRQWSDYFNLLDRPYDDKEKYYTKDQSRYSAYKNFIHTGEIMLRFIRNTYDFNIGVQVIPQTSEYTQRYLNVDTVVNRSVTNWSPTANFRWRFSQQGNLRFEYRGTTSQPSIDQLLVINDDTNPLNKTTGNPDLKPSFTQRFNLRFNNYIMNHQRFINANANFSTTANSISNKVTYDEETGGRTTRPENINGNWNAGANIMFSSAIDSLGYFNYSIQLSDNYNHRVSYLDQNNQAVRNTTNQNTMGARLGTGYRNDWLETELNGSINYTKSRNELQPASNLNNWSFSYGMNTTLTMPWGTQIATDIAMNSRRGFSDESMNTNELIWNAQIAHSFLQGKPLTVSLQFYDILRQQSNFSRTINDMARTDNEYNAITSYAMLHVIYRINLFGTREARRGMRGGMGFGGPGSFGGGMPGGGNRGGNRGGGFGGGGFGGGFGGGNRF